MKIAFVLDDTLDTPDGVQQYIVTLGGWLSSQGHNVHYLVGQTTRQDIAGVHALSRNVKVRFNGNRMSMPLPASRSAIRKLLAAEQFDVIHVQMPYSPFMAHRVILAAPARTAVVGTFHIAPHSGLVAAANRALALLLRRSLKRFDTLLSVSSAAQDFARQTYGIETSVLPNVVDVGRFAAARPYKRYAGKPTIVFLGRLVPRKGCMLLLQAVHELRAAEPKLDFAVVICGRGPLEAELKAYVAEHQLGDTVEFVGFVNEVDKVRYYKSADLAVFPSSGGESFGIVLIEAMAAGSGVVLAADNPGYGAVLAPYPAILFPVGDAAALSAKLAAFLTSESQRAQALEWQAGYVPQFDTAAVGARLVAVYKRALETRQRS